MDGEREGRGVEGRLPGVGVESWTACGYRGGTAATSISPQGQAVFGGGRPGCRDNPVQVPCALEGSGVCRSGAFIVAAGVISSFPYWL